MHACRIPDATDCRRGSYAYDISRSCGYSGYGGPLKAAFVRLGESSARVGGKAIQDLCRRHIFTPTMQRLSPTRRCCFRNSSRAAEACNYVKVHKINALRHYERRLSSKLASLLFLLPTMACYIQGSAKRRSPGLVNFVTVVAYHLCLSLPAAFTQPG